MRYCSSCQKTFGNDFNYCPSCGGATIEQDDFVNLDAQSEKNYYNEEQECLDNFYKFFKWERLMWKIGGIVFLVCSIIIFLCSIIIIAALSSVSQPELGFGLGYFYLMLGIIYLPIAIINLKMVKKAEYYMNTLYTDARPMVTRCQSIGMIVFAAFFSNLALIFIIVNFVRAKTNDKVLQRIIRNQLNRS